jgi:hypothetical protein
VIVAASLSEGSRAVEGIKCIPAEFDSWSTLTRVPVHIRRSDL